MNNEYLGRFLERMLRPEVAGRVLRALAEIEVVPVTAQECIALNQGVQAHYGGIHGVRSLHLLESAIAAPLNKVAYEGASCTVEGLGDLLMERLIKNHAFTDGNKRTAILAMALFLEKNGVKFDMDQDVLYQRATEIASEPSHASKPAIAGEEMAPR